MKYALVYWIKNSFNFFISSIFCQFLYLLPINKNKIILINYINKGYCCNPKYIAEELIKRNTNYKIIWFTSKKIDYSKHFPQKLKVINISNFFLALYELATAKVWINNARMSLFTKVGLRKKPNQLYLNTWHGSLGIKKMDFQVKAFLNSANKDWIKDSTYDAKICNYGITNSQFEQEVFREGLLYKNLLNLGHPRNDIFFISNSTNIKQKVYNSYNIPEYKKIILYAPSFRDNMRMDWFKADFGKIKQAADQRFGKNFIVAVRFHPRLKEKSKQYINKSEFIIDMSEYDDIQEIMYCTDIMITDYSSCIFDFLLSQKPGFIYAEDISNYNNERGFYYRLEETPFPIAESNEQLYNNIITFDETVYKMKIEHFLDARGCIEDGKASKRVVDFISNFINEV